MLEMYRSSLVKYVILSELEVQEMKTNNEYLPDDQQMQKQLR